jgi:hypothetical protein
LVWILCFIVGVVMIPKWGACSTSGMVIFPILSFSLVVSSNVDCYTFLWL